MEYGSKLLAFSLAWLLIGGGALWLLCRLFAWRQKNKRDRSA